jgi:hypothetical protein
LSFVRELNERIQQEEVSFESEYHNIYDPSFSSEFEDNSEEEKPAYKPEPFKINEYVIDFSVS